MLSCMKTKEKKPTNHPMRHWIVRESDGNWLCAVVARTKSDARAAAKDKLKERVLPTGLKIEAGIPAEGYQKFNGSRE